MERGLTSIERLRSLGTSSAFAAMVVLVLCISNRDLKKLSVCRESGGLRCR
jgi:hypothetical protein